MVLGANWKQTAESALNAGQTIRGAIVVALMASTRLFVAAHSSIGYARWKLQRELWRRDVERLTGAP